MNERTIRGAVAGFVLGAVLVGAGTAGMGARTAEPARDVRLPGTVAGASEVLAAGAQLPGGQFLAGAARVSIEPDPAKWVPDVPAGRCQTVNPDPGCLQTFDMLWAKSVREPGVFARAAAISNGADTLILSVLDVVGWFDTYPADVCGDCGSRAIRASMSSELDVPAANIVISSTHTHASGNSLAAMPRWYFEQVRDATKQAIRDAHAAMEPAWIDVGSTTSRWNNADRRVVSRAVPDYEVQWLHASARSDGRTITAITNNAAHPTVLASNDTLHSGFPGYANLRMEEKLGGIGLWFPSGIGDQTVVRSRGRDGLGNRLADAVLLDMQESPRRLTTNDIAADVRDIPVPGDNAGLLALRAANVFVRDILPPAGGGPVAGRYGKNSTRPTCVGAGFLSVVTPIGAFRLGEAAIALVPGEAFASISLVIKDYYENAGVVFVIGLANDQLGYILPYNQFDETGHQGIGIASPSTKLTEYEESLSLGRCFGELLMDELIKSGKTLGVVP